MRNGYLIFKIKLHNLIRYVYNTINRFLILKRLKSIKINTDLKKCSSCREKKIILQIILQIKEKD